MTTTGLAGHAGRSALPATAVPVASAVTTTRPSAEALRVGGGTAAGAPSGVATLRDGREPQASVPHAQLAQPGIEPAGDDGVLRGVHATGLQVV